MASMCQHCHYVASVLVHLPSRQHPICILLDCWPPYRLSKSSSLFNCRYTLKSCMRCLKSFLYLMRPLTEMAGTREALLLATACRHTSKAIFTFYSTRVCGDPVGYVQPSLICICMYKPCKSLHRLNCDLTVSIIICDIQL